MPTVYAERVGNIVSARGGGRSSSSRRRSFAFAAPSAARDEPHSAAQALALLAAALPSPAAPAAIAPATAAAAEPAPSAASVDAVSVSPAPPAWPAASVFPALPEASAEASVGSMCLTEAQAGDANPVPRTELPLAPSSSDSGGSGGGSGGGWLSADALTQGDVLAAVEARAAAAVCSLRSECEAWAAATWASQLTWRTEERAHWEALAQVRAKVYSDI